MNTNEFSRYAAEGYNRIPVHRTILSDTDTPLSSYIKLVDGPYGYLFESVEGGEKWGRYSIIGLPARERVEIYGNTVHHIKDDKELSVEECADPLAFVREFQQRFKVLELGSLPDFNGGLVGYFGYDTVRMIEPKLAGKAPRDELELPDIMLLVSDEVVVFDNLQGRVHLICNADPSQPSAYQNACERLDQLVERLSGPLPEIDRIEPKDQVGKTMAEGTAVSQYGKKQFMRDVEKVKDYILAGDTMQVVLSQRMVADFDSKPLNLYRALRSLNPSPYMYFLDLGDHQVVGSSPEILARLQHGEVTVRPIAGTRRRGYTEEEDAALEQELINDPKEIAEHLMLIDLGRNDVGRVSQVGSVNLTEKMVVEKFSHVLHITSNVVGKLEQKYDAIDVLKAAHPAGTLSGAPKIRAMEIIDEFEPTKRSVYGGAVGYLAWNGNLDLAIAIRTAVVKNQKIYIQAGAGIVADSIPEMEWKETLNKARALFGAVDWVSS